MPARLLVANRGEVAVRILRTAAELGIPTVAVVGDDDAGSRHARLADEVHPLPGRGPAAYLDADRLVGAATETGCDALHPGYGFLSEDPALARACAAAGVAFVGPRPEVLETMGDKTAARALAVGLGVPVLPGTTGPTSLVDAEAFLAGLGPGGAVMVKALAGGGGRGMRAVADVGELAPAWERCRSEAEAAFGRGDLYVEALLGRARHVEVQLVGDGTGAVAALGTRECSLQRRRQKLVEVAPALALPAGLAEALVADAVRLGAEVGLDGVATVELLVDTSDRPVDAGYAFLEVNPRLQVEHTVTEEVTGLDLVALQLRLADGAHLDDLGLVAGPGPAVPVRGTSLQLRVYAETPAADGSVRPSVGTVSALEVPSGPGVRVDAGVAVGDTTSGRFDPLLAKVVVTVPTGGLDAALARARRALRELHVAGVATNAAFLTHLLDAPEVVAGEWTTAFVDDHLAELVPDAAAGEGPRPVAAEVPPGAVGVVAPVLGTVVAVEVAEGDLVPAGRPLVVLEAMKLEHVVAADVGGEVVRVAVAEGDAVAEGQVVVVVAEADVAGGEEGGADEVDLDHVRPDLAEVHARHAVGLDDARPDAVARRRRTGQRTARENVADLCDEGSFVEYGPLAIAAQRRRRSVEELVAATPADGLVGGVGTVNAEAVGPDRARCVVASYDYTVLAGTQGYQNHRKKDRLFELAEAARLPVVLFTEGGGGRPGDTDAPGVSGLDTMAFHLFGRLSGEVPLVGIASGRCFAGNAALLGCCDVVIATEGSTIGMGGPAMIEGGGLGTYRPEEVGPLPVQVGNGVVDVAVADEAEAVDVARRYLSYFQGPVADWSCTDQRVLRHLVPEHRLRVYDVRAVVEALADTGSVLELRRGFGRGMVTALVRVEGQPMGLVANDPGHLAGAIDSHGADKAARFLALCDAFDLPVLLLCDTPGIMVGPDAEATGLVRHASRLFVTGASLTVPFGTIVLRKGYGLGAQAMAGGSFKAPRFCVAWPTGEVGGMGLEGAVRLGYRRELEAVDDPAERQALFEEMVARAYQHGKALNSASHFEIDDVIDPADSRRWITALLAPRPAGVAPAGGRRPHVDTW